MECIRPECIIIFEVHVFPDHAGEVYGYVEMVGILHFPAMDVPTGSVNIQGVVLHLTFGEFLIGVFVTV